MDFKKVWITYVGGENRKRKDGTIRRTWRCYSATKFGKKHIVNNQELGCDNDRVNNEILKECFMRTLKEIVSDKQKIKKEVEEYVRDAVSKCQGECKTLDIYIEEKEKLIKERNKLLDLCIKGFIDDNTFKAKKEEIDNKIDGIEKEISKQEDKKLLKDNIEDIIENVRKSVDKILNIKEFSKNVCRELVDKVIIYNSKKFDFFLKGYKTPFNFSEKSNILCLQH